MPKLRLFLHHLLHHLFQIGFLRGTLVKLPLPVSLIWSVLIGILFQVLALIVLVVPPVEIWVISPSGIVSIGVRIILRLVIIVECIHLLRIPFSRSTSIAVYD
jgi:hypothetical protein